MPTAKKLKEKRKVQRNKKPMTVKVYLSKLDIQIRKLVKERNKIQARHINQDYDYEARLESNYLPADYKLEMVVNDIGYQADTTIMEADNIHGTVMTECRDFGGSPDRKKCLEDLHQMISKTIDKWRNKY